MELKVPQTQGLAFYPQCLGKTKRSERALKWAVAEMYVQGVVIRRIAPVVEKLRGLDLSSTQVSFLSAIGG